MSDELTIDDGAVGYATDDVGAQLVGSALGRAVAVLSLVTGCAARG